MNSPTDRPLVLINMAMAADGGIATANRRITSFGSPNDQRHLYELRATVDAILCGANTVRESHATLDSGSPLFRKRRRQHGLTEHALRIVVSGSASLSSQAPILNHKHGPIIVLATQRADPTRLAGLRRLGVTVACFGEEHVALAEALTWLHRKFGVRRLLCEGGSRLNAAMLRAGLVDELHLTVCPFLCGGRAAPTIADGHCPVPLAAATQATLHSARRKDNELYLVYQLQPPREPSVQEIG